MMPEDQRILRDCMRRTSIIDDFLDAQLDAEEKWYQTNLTMFLEVCQMHGETAIQHHNQLVEKYIAKPSESLKESHLDKVTASGPPLSVLLSGLEKLRNRRAAVKRKDLRTRFDDIQTLKASLHQTKKRTAHV
jgi:hypothetical protein